MENFAHVLSNKTKVVEHDHYTGKYNGPAHQECNLKCKQSKKINVFFHNLKGYDAHHLITACNEYSEKHDVSVIATTAEKYISLSIGNLVFKDSFAFLASSLDTLSRQLNREDLIQTQKLIESYGLKLDDFQEKNDKDKLVMRKGVYPYCFVDDEAKFDTTEFPPIEAFTSDLKKQKIKRKDYDYGKHIWNLTKCKTFKDYHTLYLKLDVALLADVFETFRRTSLEKYKLDPCHYFTLPGMSFDALLKRSGISLELLTDLTMYEFFEQSLRGGITQVSHRHMKANNEDLKNYNP